MYVGFPTKQYLRKWKFYEQTRSYILYWYPVSLPPVYRHRWTGSAGYAYMSGRKPYSCKKGNPIFVEGDPARFIGIILTGTAQVIREDYYGHRSVMTDLQPGDLFAEAFSCAGLSTVPISVFAMTDSDILLLDCHHLLTSCSNSCDFHNTLIRNLLHEIARKTLR